MSIERKSLMCQVCLLEIANPAIGEAQADKPADDGTNETDKEEESQGCG